MPLLLPYSIGYMKVTGPAQTQEKRIIKGVTTIRWEAGVAPQSVSITVLLSMYRLFSYYCSTYSKVTTMMTPPHTKTLILFSDKVINGII